MELKTIGVVRDAEQHPAKSAMDSIRSALDRAGLALSARYAEPGKPAVYALVLPDDCNPGMLETLLWKSVVDMPAAGCVEEYLDCAERYSGEPIQRRDKARAHAFLATRPLPHVSVGVAAQKGYWDFGHDAFAGVRAFLEKVAAQPDGGR